MRRGFLEKDTMMFELDENGEKTTEERMQDFFKREITRKNNISVTYGRRLSFEGCCERLGSSECQIYVIAITNRKSSDFGQACGSH